MFVRIVRRDSKNTALGLCSENKLLLSSLNPIIPINGIFVLASNTSLSTTLSFNKFLIEIISAGKSSPNTMAIALVLLLTGLIGLYDGVALSTIQLSETVDAKRI